VVTTLRSLIEVERFRLRLLVPPADPAILDEPLTWAHSSDLPDPTPWLEPGQLLLTDGDHFLRNPDQASADAYIERLRAASVRALGFAIGVIHDEVPEPVVRAAQTTGYPLVEVAGRTPFMAIIRHVADEIAAEQRARIDWLMTSQRAIARAALRVDGLTAILHELEDRLDCWVALFDAAGERVTISTQRPLPVGLDSAVHDAARRALRGRVRSGVRLAAGGEQATLQTLGRRDRLRGVLAIGTAAPLDAAGNDLVTSVLALASIALEQSRALEDARRSLREGVLELLLAGSVEAAGRSLAPIAGPLPSPPLRVIVTPADGDRRLLIEELELGAERGHGPFFAVRGDRLVLVVGEDELEALRAVLTRHGAVAGASGPAELHELRSALTEAERAWAAAQGRAGVCLRLFDELAGEGMIGLLGAGGGREAARRMLETVRQGAGDQAEELLGMASVWLAHNGAWDPAARELGVHRHTLRARMAALGALLHVDLERFPARVELWAAIRLDSLQRDEQASVQ
jgi:purine catabolism regulator